MDDLSPERAGDLLRQILSGEEDINSLELAAKILAERLYAMLLSAGPDGLSATTIRETLVAQMRAGAKLSWMFEVGDTSVRDSLVKDALGVLWEDQRAEMVPGSNNWRRIGILDAMAQEGLGRGQG